jgi:hypothetical protein
MAPIASASGALLGLIACAAHAINFDVQNIEKDFATT